MNWSTIRKRDEELRTTADNASEALAKLRWENTLGRPEATENRPGYTEYAREVGVTVPTVRYYALAHEMVMKETAVSLPEALNKARFSGDRADVIGAVAKARNISPATVRGTGHLDEVREIEMSAREAAVKNATSVKEEAEKLAQAGAKRRARQAKEKAQADADGTGQWLRITGELSGVIVALRNILEIDAPTLSDDAVESIQAKIEKARAALGLIELKFTGDTVVDWDQELANFTEKEAS